MNNSYIEVLWSPSHPNVIRKRDSERVKKKKMKRWPSEEDRNTPFYAWFWCEEGGVIPDFSLPSISLEELIEK